MDKYVMSVAKINREKVAKLQEEIIYVGIDFQNADLKHKILVSEIHAKVVNSLPNMHENKLFYEVESQTFQNADYLDSYNNLLSLQIKIEVLRYNLQLYLQFGEE